VTFYYQQIIVIILFKTTMQQNKPNPIGSTNQDSYQYVGPYRLEKTLGKGQTGKYV
jgi:hypothetical protein